MPDRNDTRKPELRSYDGVLFDLDGTLVDTLDLILASFRHTMATHLGKVPPDEEWLRTLGTPLKQQLAGFARAPAEADAMFRTYLAHNQENHRRLIRAFPGMRETVAALHEGGYPLAIVTSKLRKQAVRELRHCRLEGYFRMLVCADDVVHPKPHPEPVRQAAEALHTPTDRLLFIGDSVHDLHAGRAAGVDTAAALWGPFDRDRLAPGAPDHWLESIADLRALLGLAAGGPDA